MDPIESELVPGTDPPVYAIVSTAWKLEGIPRLRITYSERPTGIELLTLTLWL